MYNNGYFGGTAAAGSETPGPDNVREIFPGAMDLAPVANRTHTATLRALGREAGMATAEYAIATLAAVGFAGLLVVILKSDEVRGFLLNIIRTALSF
jgi:hypothetical protein